MTQDQNRKTPRQFQCRDYLWEIFEQMSAELECSVDYLINESMRQYARSRNYGGQRLASSPNLQMPPGQSMQPPGAPAAQTPASGSAAMPLPPPPLAKPTFPTQLGVAPLGQAAGPAVVSPPLVTADNFTPPFTSAPQGQSFAPPAAQSFAPPPMAPAQQFAPPAPPVPAHAPPAYAPPAQAFAPAPTPPAVPGYQQQFQAAPAHPPTPVAGSSFPPGPTLRPTNAGPAVTIPPPLPGVPRVTGALPALFVIFNGQKIPVNKEEFVIGRGTKTADLAIKDGNISRRHAAVVFQGGAFYVKDLGSTNGVEHQGKRVDTRRIEEGDIYQICDYELRFTYK